MKEPKIILLIEDDDKDVELTLTALEDCDLPTKVVVARDGVDALDYLYRRGNFKSRPEGNPVVILLDLKMPKVGGLEVLRIIKSDERLKTIPTVALTSSRERKDVEESYKMGINAYVVKPVDFKQFREAIKGMCGFWGVINEPFPGSVGNGE